MNIEDWTKDGDLRLFLSSIFDFAVIVIEFRTANKDEDISIISSKLRKQLTQLREGTNGAREWHSDITFEKVPADYTSLRVHTLPHTGGDTLWASGYELYDLLSPPFRNFFDTLSAHFAQPGFNRSAEANGFKLHAGPRGAAENVGEDLSADHPLIRTNPVTGWKSIFGLGTHFAHVNNVTEQESDIIKRHILELLISNHATQVVCLMMSSVDP